MAKHRFSRLFLSLLVCMSFGEMVAYAQTVGDKIVTISVKQAKLSKILKSIQDKSAIQIVYNGQLVDRAAIQTVEAKNEKLTTLLNRVLQGTGLTYTIQKNVVIIHVKPMEKTGAMSTPSVAASTSSYVYGKVLVGNNLPKSLVTVSNKETGIHTLTDANGGFTIQAEPGHHLQFSHVGYTATQVTLKNLKELQITLSPIESKLDEVVLTGYQSIEKKLSTGSIFTLKGKDVAEPNVSNIASMLQGKVPGLAIETVSGSPNAIPRMRIRGTSTLIGNANPIWVIDGIVQENPTDIDPDKPLGLNPTFLDKLTRGDLSQSRAGLMGNSILGVNINDIESISFLKDAAATALYGTRAANGVILLTTKRGQVGPTVVNYNASLGFTERPSYSRLQLMDSKQRVQLSRELIEEGLLHKTALYDYGYEGAYWELINKRITEEEFNTRVAKLETQNTDWFDILFRNAVNHQHAINLSGGSDKTTYSASINYSDENHAAKKEGINSIGGRIGISSKLNKKLQVNFDISANLSTSQGYYGLFNPMTYAINTSRTIDPDFYYSTKAPMFGSNVVERPLHYNALNETRETNSETKTSFLRSQLNLNYEILRGLRFKTTFGGQVSNQRGNRYATERSYQVASLRGYDYGSVVPGGIEEQESALPFGGILDTDNNAVYNFTWNNLLYYNKDLFGGRDKLSLVVGQEIVSVRRQGNNQFEYGYLKDRGENFANLDMYYYNFQRNRENKIENKLSGLATATYAYDQKYIVTGSTRMDASNRFGQYTNSRFLPVWSVSGRWNISDEPWLQNSKWISQLELKGSYGSQGNAVTQVGPDLILTIPTFGAIHPQAREYILKMKSLAYPDLRWEKTISKNIEMQMGLFDSFIRIGTSFYHKQTDDVITGTAIPVEYGISSMLINGGAISNKGWELSVNLNPIRNKNWNWTISGNTSRNYNNLEKANVDQIYKLEDYLNGTVQLPNEPIGTFYVFDFKGLNQNDGLPTFNVIDEKGDQSALTYKDYLKNAGVKHYTITGGLHTALEYKNWSLSASFTLGLGAHRLRTPLFGSDEQQTTPTTEQNMQTWLIDRWRKPGDEQWTNIPRFVDHMYGQLVRLGDGTDMSRYRMYDASDALLAKADYLKCRSLSLGYTVPKDWAKRVNLSSASLQLNVSNVFTIADKVWRGQDPEVLVVGGIGLPQLPSYNLSVNISF